MLFDYRTELLCEKSKNKKWNVVPFGKKTKHKNLNEAFFITQDLFNQVYQLIHVINQDESIDLILFSFIVNLYYYNFRLKR